MIVYLVEAGVYAESGPIGIYDSLEAIWAAYPKLNFNRHGGQWVCDDPGIDGPYVITQWSLRTVESERAK